MSKSIFRLSALLALAFLPVIAHAAADPSAIWIYCGNLPGCGPGFDEHFSSVLILLLTRVPNYVYILGVLFIMVGGGYMVLAFGDTEKINKGKTTILWALVGILVMQYADVFVNAVVIPEVQTREGGADLITSVARTAIGTIFDLLQISMLIVAVYCGIRLVLSFGKEDEFKKYREGMVWAAIGAIVINLAAALAHAFCISNQSACFVF